MSCYINNLHFTSLLQ